MILMSVDTCITNGETLWENTDYYFASGADLSAFLSSLAEDNVYAVNGGYIYQINPIPQHAKTSSEHAPVGSKPVKYSLPVLLASIHPNKRRIHFAKTVIQSTPHPELWDAHNYLDIKILVRRGQRARAAMTADRI